MKDESMSKDKRTGLQDLIEALAIFAKYDKTGTHRPLYNYGDTLMVAIEPAEGYDDADIERLHELGFDFCDVEKCWYSHRFGSA